MRAGHGLSVAIAILVAAMLAPSASAEESMIAGAAAPVLSTTAVAAAAAPAPAPEAAQGPRGEAVTEPAKPTPTGLERFSDDWPKWVKVGLQYRGRFESTHPTTTANGVTDAYYLNRIRLRTTLVATSWLNGVVEGHDMQVMKYDSPSAPRGHANSFDLRQGYVEATPTLGHNKVLVRAGRQELTFGEGRLIASPDWGNSSRTFDVVRTGIGNAAGRVDIFTGGMVLPDATHFDKITDGERFYGAYGSLTRLFKGGVVEPYYIVRRLRTATSERGGVGDAEIRTVGGRGTAKLRAHVDVGVEYALQRGHLATDAINAWGGHAALGWTPAGVAGKPRLWVEYNVASGDRDAHDGVRQTFDQLYPSNHAKYGLADQIAWRNMRDFGVGAEFVPARKVKVTLGAHQLKLATINDAYYGTGGSRLLLNVLAPGRNVGVETDGSAAWNVSKELTFGVGVGTLWSGDYLIGTNHTAHVTFPHVFWTAKF